MIAAGLDLSLTKTGIAVAGRAWTIGVKARGTERLSLLTTEIAHNLLGRGIHLVAIEGYSYGSKTSQAHSIGELGGCVRRDLHHEGVPFVVVAPTSLKKFATGNGRAKKEEMVANARERLGYEGFDDDEADALFLEQVALHMLGSPDAKRLPRSHLTVIDKLEVE